MQTFDAFRKGTNVIIRRAGESTSTGDHAGTVAWTDVYGIAIVDDRVRAPITNKPLTVFYPWASIGRVFVHNEDLRRAR